MFDAASRTIPASTPPAADKPDMLSRLNAITVDPDLLAIAANALSDAPDDKRNDFDQRMIVLIDVLKRNPQEAKLSLLALAIDFRLRALARLIEATFVLGCEVDLVSRRPRVTNDALRAACKERLVRNKAGLASFDISSFKARLLH